MKRYLQLMNQVMFYHYPTSASAREVDIVPVQLEHRINDSILKRLKVRLQEILGISTTLPQYDFIIRGQLGCQSGE
eukprot:scaffold224913_cov36-Tisochrysis_lutea.AAC.4